GTESDDVIDVFEISDADTDSSFAIMGLAGDDEISGGNGTDILSGNEGDDIVSGRDGRDFLRGGKGGDQLIGGKGGDILIGDHGIDLLTGGLGADSFILRANIIDGIEEIDEADLITDFNVADNDQIIVVANFIPSEGLTYELFGDDTVIRLSDSGFILGVVSDTSIEEVENNIVAVSADDYALRLG
uniref:calcium-binding protein n=1 Tax=Okeania hirsuta TaxID=1458930 RepID=UPI000FA60748